MVITINVETGKIISVHGVEAPNINAMKAALDTNGFIVDQEYALQ